MKLLALDISSNTGWSLFEGGQSEAGNPKPALLKYGTVTNEQPAKAYADYPWSYPMAAEDMARKIMALVNEHEPGHIVIEETNLGKQRYSQKYLEMIHCCVLQHLENEGSPGLNVGYISSGTWRHVLGVGLTKDDKKNNSKLSKVKSDAKKKGVSIHEAKKKAGIKGKVSKKHASVRHVNDVYELKLKIGQNDIADSICLGLAYFMNAPLCNGE